MFHRFPLLGFHASITGGLHKALDEAALLECPTIQIFTKNNRTWKEPILTNDAIELFIKKKQAYAIDPIISHASYLINLAAADKAIRAQSIKALTAELERCEQLGIAYVILHPGSHTILLREEGMHHIIEGCKKALETTKKTMLLLETMAGQGSSIGTSFEEIATLLKGINHTKRVGVCLDTCHVFAAGYRLSTEEDYHALMKQFDETCGIANLKTIHVNDSKKEAGSCVDRHEDIGKGKIKIEFFEHLMNDIRLKDIPKILETPKETPEDDAHNLKTLRNLVKK